MEVRKLFSPEVKQACIRVKRLSLRCFGMDPLINARRLESSEREPEDMVGRALSLRTWLVLDMRTIVSERMKKKYILLNEGLPHVKKRLSRNPHSLCIEAFLQLTHTESEIC
jgi:hypothetical protein